MRVVNGQVDHEHLRVLVDVAALAQDVLELRARRTRDGSHSRRHSRLRASEPRASSRVVASRPRASPARGSRPRSRPPAGAGSCCCGACRSGPAAATRHPHTRFFTTAAEREVGRARAARGVGEEPRPRARDAAPGTSNAGWYSVIYVISDWDEVWCESRDVFTLPAALCLPAREGGGGAAVGAAAGQFETADASSSARDDTAAARDLARAGRRGGATGSRRRGGSGGGGAMIVAGQRARSPEAVEARRVLRRDRPSVHAAAVADLLVRRVAPVLGLRRQAVVPVAAQLREPHGPDDAPALGAERLGGADRSTHSNAFGVTPAVTAMCGARRPLDATGRGARRRRGRKSERRLSPRPRARPRSRP